MDQQERIIMRGLAIVGWGIAMTVLWPYIPLAIYNRMCVRPIKETNSDGYPKPNF